MKPALALAGLLTALPATAQAGSWGGVFSAVTLASDYRYQGVSESLGKPVVQGYVHWARPDGFYLGAFGPATVADAQRYCGLQGLKPVFEGLREELEVFRAGKRELFDR